MLVGMFIYALISLCNAFKDSIEVDNSDKLSMYSAIVLTVVFAILVIIAMNYINNLISPLGDLSSLL